MNQTKESSRKRISKKQSILIAIGLVLLLALWIAFCGWQWSWGPFSALHDLQTMRLPGNAQQYALEQVEPLGASPLQNLHICFLGSSVTYGSSAMGTSFADYIGKRNGCTITKEAVPGTTLVEAGANSYIARLKALDKNRNIDLLVCQLSTNDASQNKPLGEVNDATALTAFDTSTVTGAVEYIICYAEETWRCPVVFFTNANYESEAYEAMVQQLIRLQGKWGIGVIDLWSDAGFNAITQEQRSLYMSDSIHPTQAGYLLWWTPKMETVLYEYVTLQP